MRPILPMLAASVLLAGCSESTGVQPEDLAGTWTATQFTFQSVATPALQVDAVADLGLTVTVTIQAGGAVSLSVSGGGTETGTLTVTGSNFTLVLDGDTTTGTIARDGDRITLNITAGLEFDFNDDDVDEPATGTAVFQKN